MKAQKISVDLRIVCVALLIIIGGMLVSWRPWSGTSAKRTIDVTGEATIKAEPDEFMFSPSYQKKGADKAAIQKELISKVDMIISELKKLGVDESDITLNSNTYDNFYIDGADQVVSNGLTIVVANKELSQKVQDYLITTAPDGQLTPYPTFSKEKEKEIEAQARSKALADARKKADSTAKELGVKVGKVVTIADQQNAVAMPYFDRALGMGTAEVSSDTKVSLPVLPGKQDVQYSITVTYELK
jgi:uncharacterized protein YggE